MNRSAITPNESRAARAALGLSQAFVARETGINRSQLALFEVGKYRLEPYKLLALRDCYARLGHALEGGPGIDASAPSLSLGHPGRDAETRANATPSAESPRIEDDFLIGSGVDEEDVRDMLMEIDCNDARIDELAEQPVKRHWLGEEPITRERDALIRIMARNYQLMRALQGQALLPDPARSAGSVRPSEPRTTGELAAALLADPNAFKPGR